MNEKQSSSSGRLPGPLRAITPDLRHVPGVEQVSKAAEGALNAVGIVSPHGRRIAAYTGAGLLGVAGVIEWPIAVAGAAAVWLTQPRPEEDGHRGAHDGQGQHTPAAKGQTKSRPKSHAKTTTKSTTKSTAKSPAKSQTKTTAKSHSPSKAKSTAKATAKPTAKATGKATGKATTSGGRSRTASGTKATKRPAARATAS
ncbi:hypothetical protein [Streptomyces violens]|uniref:hypothetical protein n=1 Tax=Streptomyces violens TaxID=66377 RepID=UPI0012FECAFF|nr:hypothetical protein [Streptomyces violens]